MLIAFSICPLACFRWPVFACYMLQVTFSWSNLHSPGPRTIVLLLIADKIWMLFFKSNLIRFEDIHGSKFGNYQARPGHVRGCFYAGYLNGCRLSNARSDCKNRHSQHPCFTSRSFITISALDSYLFFKLSQCQKLRCQKGPRGSWKGITSAET